MFIDPVEGSVDKGEWRVAVCCFGTKFTSWTAISMAGLFGFSGSVGFVEWVRVEVCRKVSLEGGSGDAGQSVLFIPVMCRNLPCSLFGGSFLLSLRWPLSAGGRMRGR